MNDNTKEWDGQEKYILLFLSGLRTVKVNLSPKDLQKKMLKQPCCFRLSRMVLVTCFLGKMEVSNLNSPSPCPVSHRDYHLTPARPISWPTVSLRRKRCRWARHRSSDTHTHAHTQNAGQVPHWSLICWYFFKLGNPKCYPVLLLFFSNLFAVFFSPGTKHLHSREFTEMTPRFLREISGHGLSLSWQWYKGESSQRKGPPAMSHGPG